jgi:hypothetical protein
MSQAYYIPRVGEPIFIYSSVKLVACLTLLRKINWARRKGKREMADRLLKDLHTLEGKS